MLKTRVLTAAIALPAILAAILFLPNRAFSLLIGILGVWGLYEIYEMVGSRSVGVLLGLVVLGLVPLGGFLAFSEPGTGAILWVVAIGLVMFSLIVRVSSKGPEDVRAVLDGQPVVGRDTMLSNHGFASVGFFFPYFARLRNGPNGIALVILMLLLVVCADSGAYFVGRAIGRHKLAFKVSPGKTIEGAIGGVLASIAGGLILRGWLVAGWGAVETLIFSALIAVLAIIGDLANSAFKRVAGVKDSGWIFPGHGGLLDRTCSLVLAAVFTYYYSR